MTRFEIEQKDIDVVMKEMHALFNLKFPQLVMRFMNTRLDTTKTLNYQKPESLEDIPTQDVDKFLRENKMEGLLKKGAPKGSASAAPESADVVQTPPSAVEESSETVKVKE